MPVLVHSRIDLGPYFRCLADNLGLRDWTISILDGPPENPNAAASIRCLEGRKRAEIDLSDRFMTDDETDQRHVAVHELLHCHHAHQGHLMAKWLDDEAFDAYVLCEENTIDALADAIAPLMPLPSKILGKLGTKPKPKSAKKRNQ